MFAGSDSAMNSAADLFEPLHPARRVTISTQPVPLRLKPSRQFPFMARHPWVHAHALDEDGRDLDVGQVVDLTDHDGNWIARGVINPNSRLRVRLYAFDQGIEINDALWRERIDAAIGRRRLCQPVEPHGAERLVFSESDLISGLIVDRYADCLSIQFTAGGLLPWRDVILSHLRSATDCNRIMVRIDAKTAKYEGIDAEDGWASIDATAEANTAPVAYQQNGLQLSVDLSSGQKTGGYLDQRLNHLAAASYMKDRRVLDVCCYAGGFGLVAASLGAASVTGVDSSEAALAAAGAAAERNGLTNISFTKADCFDELKRLGESSEKFDAVILDPPRFAGSRHQIDSAVRAYRRLNSLALDLLPAGGILVTCSCSGRVSRAEFTQMLSDVGRRRRRDLILLENRGPAPDHPVAAACPETDYLKCVIAQVR
tara:strand:- start:51882 stop:53165 length:1284 start_codon:yes stop_codon:yes gene_type:complete